jgi:2-C-methyl-D-erythritol 4-phosphate cytidylyltransferase/2-C-methyl-D-erythritol 2,4-cyclodiphosphate synthase
MGSSGGERINKMLMKFGGITPVEHCLRRFRGLVDEAVIVASDSTYACALAAAEKAVFPVKVVSGGPRRQDSVLNGVRATGCDIVAIHDCARFAVPESVIKEAISSAADKGSGAAAIKARDTLRSAKTGADVPRDGLVQMQTPQCFDRERLLEAYRISDEDATDDVAVWQRSFGRVELTEGSVMNQKLTEFGDIEYFNMLFKGESDMRIGIGEDTHRLVEGRKLILGGVEIPFRLGLLGHSDADALIHAVIDALLGAAALGDIGRHFPDKDPQYKGISSLVLLEKTSQMLKGNGFAVSNIDAVITAQEPKLAPYIDQMREKIAGALSGVGIKDISVKATTPEHLGPEGNLESITVRAVACVRGLV